MTLRKPKIDETGKRYGMLVVEKEGSRGPRGVSWWAICDCGNKTIIEGVLLRTGKVNSCGCLRKKQFFRHLENLKNQKKRWDNSRAANHNRRGIK